MNDRLHRLGSALLGLLTLAVLYVIVTLCWRTLQTTTP